MTTSPNDLKDAENFLTGKMAPDDALLFQATHDTGMLRKTFSLIRQFGRRNLKAEIEQVHQRLFTDPDKISFREKIERLFTKL
jgi:hypothetical protein